MEYKRGTPAAGANLLRQPTLDQLFTTIAKKCLHNGPELATHCHLLLQISVGQAEGKDKSGFSITALHAPAQETSCALAAACSDGRLRLLSYSGRIERVTDAAHDGSVVCVRWNRNGTAVATGGEDGALKTWSATAMIRATVAQSDKPVYSLAWSPDNTSV